MVLRCSVETVERYVFAHQIAVVQIGRNRRFWAQEVLEFVSGRSLPTRGKTRRPQGSTGEIGAFARVIVPINDTKREFRSEAP